MLQVIFLQALKLTIWPALLIQNIFKFRYCLTYPSMILSTSKGFLGAAHHSVEFLHLRFSTQATVPADLPRDQSRGMSHDDCTRLRLTSFTKIFRKIIANLSLIKIRVEFIDITWRRDYQVQLTREYEHLDVRLIEQTFDCPKTWNYKLIINNKIK